MSQTVSVPSTVPTLTFQYRVHTFDTVYGLVTRQYYDTFEFSVGKAPDQITEAERESKVAEAAPSIPTIQLSYEWQWTGLLRGGTPTDTLGIEWDSGWLTVSVNLSAFAGVRSHSILQTGIGIHSAIF